MTNQFLENERIALEEKITEAREKGNENTYKNLIQAYERVLELSRKENKWEDMYSHYYKGDKKINGENEYVATWKQNYAGDIKDHKIYKVEKEIKENQINKLYYDIGRIDKNSKCIIFFKDKMTTVIGDYKYIATYISSLCQDENVEIHGDINGFGLGLADELMSIGLIVKPTTLTVFDITRNIGGKEIKQDYSKLR
jgi:hypothetical protein